MPSKKPKKEVSKIETLGKEQIKDNKEKEKFENKDTQQKPKASSKPYCTKCQRVDRTLFNASVNKFHANGCLPYCKDCVKEMFNSYFKKYENFEVVVYLVCRRLDIPYDEYTYKTAIDWLEGEKSKDVNKQDNELILKYIQYLNNRFRNSLDKVHLCFDDGEHPLEALRLTVVSDVQEKMSKWQVDDESKRVQEIKDLKAKFGDNFNEKELEWLRDEYNEWANNNTINTTALERLLENLCVTRLRIKQYNNDGTEFKKFIDAQKNILEMTNLTPTKNMSTSDGKMGILGMRIKDLETRRPADDPKLKVKYADWDGHENFAAVYVRAPLKESLGIEDNDTDLMKKEVQQYKVDSEKLKEIGIDG